MWTRHKAPAAVGIATATYAEPAFLAESPYAAAQEHPALRRIRQANDIANALRPSDESTD